MFAMLLAFAAATGASAASYDDFAKGLSHNQGGDSAAAIADFTAALDAGDLAPGVVPLAWRGRGVAHIRLGHCKLALADLDEALRLRPDDLDTQVYHAEAHLCANETAAALADYTALLDKHANADVYAMRGRIRLRTGDAAGAVEDFTHEAAIQPKNGYAQLWLFIARRRAGTFDAKVAAAEADRFSSRIWPGALLMLYTGDDKPDEVLAIAARGEQKAAEYELCEADFYIGEYLLASGAGAAEAKPHFASAVGRCPQFYVERIAAGIELEQLK
jgi:lipoprotein NlpI